MIAIDFFSGSPKVSQKMVHFKQNFYLAHWPNQKYFVTHTLQKRFLMVKIKFSI